MIIPFNKYHMTGKEFGCITEAHASAHLSGDGQFTRRCNTWLEEKMGSKEALLTYFCTGALELAAILASVGPSNEVTAALG